jgi:S1-C subfamily serine protease
MALGDPYPERVRTADGKEFLLVVLAVEPVADIAVLGPPDNQELPKDADAFAEFIGRTDPAPLFRGKIKLSAVRPNPAPLFRGKIKLSAVRPNSGPLRRSLSVLVFNLDKEWVKATASVFYQEESAVFLELEKPIQSGASGGPIVTPTGELVGIVSCTTEAAAGGEDRHLSGRAPRPLYALPVWVVKTINAGMPKGAKPKDSRARRPRRKGP